MRILTASISLMDILQWLSVGGVAIMTPLLLLYKENKNREKEERTEFLDRMNIEIDKKDKQYEDLLHRVELLEKGNDELRQRNIELMHEKAVMEIEHNHIVHDLEIRISDLEKANKDLEAKIQKLKK